MTEQERDTLVEQELRDWASQVMLVLARKLVEKKLVLGGALLRSLQYQVLQLAVGQQKAIIGFYDSGRMRDMRKLHYTKMPPIKVMEDFVRKVGVDHFKFIPGSAKGRAPVSQSRAVNRIAWGIAVSIRQGNSVRRKPWFNKTFYGMVSMIEEEISKIYIEYTAQAMTEKIQNG
jgi:hypothetical protein